MTFSQQTVSFAQRTIEDKEFAVLLNALKQDAFAAFCATTEGQTDERERIYSRIAAIDDLHAVLRNVAMDPQKWGNS